MASSLRLRRYRRHVYEDGAVNRSDKGFMEVIDSKIVEKERACCSPLNSSPVVTRWTATASSPDLRFTTVSRSFEEFHEVADLVEQTDIRVRNGDPGRAAKIGVEQGVEGDALLVLLECQMLLLKVGLSGGRGCARRGGGIQRESPASSLSAGASPTVLL